MARRPEGWTLRRDERTDKWIVRFRAHGQRVSRSTGESDHSAAQVAAARIYARVAAVGTGRARTEAPLVDLAGQWLVAYGADHAAETRDECERYVASLFLPRWTSLATMTEASLAEYTRDRLRAVSASTAKKEQSALRSFFAWCVERGHLTEAPRVVSPPKRATGTPTGRHKRPDLTPAQVEALIAALPVETPSGVPIRDVVALIWDTTLRIATVRRLSVPEHYRPGARHLMISSDVDKSRFAREVPLTPRARRILDRHAREPGPIFALGEGVHRRHLYAAAVAVGLPEDVASHVGPHSLRHAAITHLATSPATNIGGVAMIAGHRTLSITSRYVHAGREAAEAALAARIGTRIGTRGRAVKGDTPKRKR